MGNMGNWETRACKWRQNAKKSVSQFCDSGKQREFNWETSLWETGKQEPANGVRTPKNLFPNFVTVGNSGSLIGKQVYGKLGNRFEE